MTTDLAPIPTDEHGEIVASELTPQQVLANLHAIEELMKVAMVKDTDYGVIPGTKHPTLLKPGAEKLCKMFRFDCQFATSKHWDGPHLMVESVCTIYHAPTGTRLGCASALATTREKKWAYRTSERICPACGKAAIIKGKEEYGGGWLCFRKKDGCGAKFADNAPEIVSQQVGQVENPDLADTYNTVVRIAEKRAHVAATRLVTGSSSIFDEGDEHAPQGTPEAPARHKEQDYDSGGWPVKPEDQPAPPPVSRAEMFAHDWTQELREIHDCETFTELVKKTVAGFKGPQKKMAWEIAVKRAAEMNWFFSEADKKFLPQPVGV